MRMHCGALPDARPLPASRHTLRVDPNVLRAITAGIPGAYYCLNPSVAVHDGQLLATIRVQFLAVPHDRAILGAIDDAWQIRGGRWMRDLSGGPLVDGRRRLGFEDLRLISWRGKLFATATVCDPSPKIAVLDVNNDGDISAVHVQRSPRDEKNWMPLVVGDQLRFVYSTEPSILLDYDGEAHEVRPAPGDVILPLSLTRGSSQLVPFEGGYVAVVHTVHEPPLRWQKNVYLHRFARFDAEGRLVRTSAPFFFDHQGIEFCAGLAEWRDGFVLGYGLDDREARLAVVNKGTVRRMLSIE
jgi:hypothetical protein